MFFRNTKKKGAALLELLDDESVHAAITRMDKEQLDGMRFDLLPAVFILFFLTFWCRLTVAKSSKEGFARHLKVPEKRKRSSSPGDGKALREEPVDKKSSAASVVEGGGAAAVNVEEKDRGNKPSAEEKKKKDAKPEWKCASCQTTNYLDRVQCRQCKTPKGSGDGEPPSRERRRSPVRSERGRGRRSRSLSRDRDRDRHRDRDRDRDRGRRSDGRGCVWSNLLVRICLFCLLLTSFPFHLRRRSRSRSISRRDRRRRSRSRSRGRGRRRSPSPRRHSR